jgi:molybdopterin molybdotransferase
MLNVKSTNEVESILREKFSKIRTKVETISIFEALHRVLSSDIIGNEFVPGFDRSTVDGLAVKAADTFGASDSTPTMLAYKGEVRMGEKSEAIEKDQCIYVQTGGQLPEGADSMVMIEYVEDHGDGMRYILSPTAPGRFISFKGDDISPGKTILKSGKKLLSHDIGTLAALGINEVEVMAKPKVAIISTGDEIVDITVTPKGAQIRDVNTYLLYSSVLEFGGEPIVLGVIKDDFSILKATISNALESCDMLLVSGGSSAGMLDHASKAIKELAVELENSELLLHGIAIKPGKPTSVSTLLGKPVFGLPGHPAAAYFIFNIFVGGVITSMLGSTSAMKTYKANLTTNIPSNHGREDCIPVELTGTFDCLQATPIVGKSGLISLFGKSQGYLRIPRDIEGLMANTEVTIYLF